MPKEHIYLKTEDLAKMFGYSTQWLHQMRHRGEGPPYLKLSHKCVRYDLEQVTAWAQSRMKGGDK
jgi:predicted DNA-binding transcriptional regulator AlpA